MPLPGQFSVVKLGVSEDYDPTFYGYYPSGTCFPIVQVHSGLFSNSASAQWLSPMHFFTTAVAVPVTCFFRNRGAFWER